MPFPEVPRQGFNAGIEHVGVFDGLVAVVVLGMHADDCGLDAQIDVLRYQRDARPRLLALQRQRLPEDQIVDADPGQTRRQTARELAGLEEQPAGGRFFAVVAAIAGGYDQPGIDLLLGDAAHHVIEKAADLACVARCLRQAFLIRIQLFEHHHRQINVVLFEAKDRGRIVHEHIRVEHEQSARGGSHSACAASRTSSAWPSTFSLRH